MRREGAIYIGCRRPTRKTRSIERDPKVSLMLESGSSMVDIKGLIIQGDATIVTEPAAVLPLQGGAPEDQLPAEVRPGAAFVRVIPRKYINWDFSKGGP